MALGEMSGCLGAALEAVFRIVTSSTTGVEAFLSWTGCKTVSLITFNRVDLGEGRWPAVLIGLIVLLLLAGTLGAIASWMTPTLSPTDG